MEHILPIIHLTSSLCYLYPNNFIIQINLPNKTINLLSKITKISRDIFKKNNKHKLSKTNLNKLTNFK